MECLQGVIMGPKRSLPVRKFCGGRGTGKQNDGECAMHVGYEQDGTHMQSQYWLKHEN